MPSIQHRRRSSSFSGLKPKINKGAVIGGSIGGLYVLISALVLILLIRRRRKKRIIREQLEIQSIASQSIYYLGYNDHLNGQPPRSLVFTQQDYRPPTRRLTHGRHASDGTVMRGGASNPFWMFDGSYEETEVSGPTRPRRSNSSPEHRRSDSISSMRSLSFEIRPATAMSMQMHMPTSVFVSEMNARFPNASSRSSKLDEAYSSIRQVPPSPSPSSSLFHEMVDQQEEGPIPPIPIEPFMRKASIDRIVSDVKERQSRERQREIQEKPQLIRVGTLNKGEKRKIVHVSRHGKSVSALSEKIMSRVRKSRNGILEDA